MSDDYAEYELECEKIRQQNAVLLSKFSDWLTGQGLSETTTRRHVTNIDLYINHYLLYEDAIPAERGWYSVGMFLGYWFIRKAMWASESSIRSNAASLKKFYTFMVQMGMVLEEDVRDLHETIKSGMPNWLATMRRYDDPSIEERGDIWGV